MWSIPFLSSSVCLPLLSSPCSLLSFTLLRPLLPFQVLPCIFLFFINVISPPTLCFICPCLLFRAVTIIFITDYIFSSTFKRRCNLCVVLCEHQSKTEKYSVSCHVWEETEKKLKRDVYLIIRIIANFFSFFLLINWLIHAALLLFSDPLTSSCLCFVFLLVSPLSHLPPSFFNPHLSFVYLHALHFLTFFSHFSTYLHPFLSPPFLSSPLLPIGAHS